MNCGSHESLNMQRSIEVEKAFTLCIGSKRSANGAWHRVRVRRKFGSLIGKSMSRCTGEVAFGGRDEAGAARCVRRAASSSRAGARMVGDAGEHVAQIGGLRRFILQVSMMVYMAAARWPPESEPAKR